MLGKTFKGLTDDMLRWQTERLAELAIDDDGWVVTVRPELVVEIAFDGLQNSTRYPGGVALRFARVVRYREDKTPAEADTLETVRLQASRLRMDDDVDDGRGAADDLLLDRRRERVGVAQLLTGVEADGQQRDDAAVLAGAQAQLLGRRGR